MIQKQSKPFFSVIICTYNRERLLKRALLSLEKQVFKDFEVVVVDDGSTDNTKSLIKKYPNIKYIKQKNKGVGEARNTGVKFAKGRYITFLDSDDQYLPKHLLFRFVGIQKNPEVDFFYGGYKVIGNPYVPDKDDHSKLIHLKYCVFGPCFVFKKKVFKLIKGYKPLRFAEDPDFFERAKKCKFKFLEIKNKTYIYNHNQPNSLTNQILNRLAN